MRDFKWDNGTPFITVGELSHLLRISESSVRRRLSPVYIPKGDEPDLREWVACKICGRWLFSREAVCDSLGLIGEAGE